MKKQTAILANLMILTSCGIDNSSTSKSDAEPLFVDYANCQEANIDHGIIANIKVNQVTGKIASVYLSEVTLEDTIPLPTLTVCKSQNEGDIKTTHCREDITDSYSMNITEGGFMPMIDAVVRTGKTGSSHQMICSYAE
jgi:hypothetical protein